MAPQMYNREGKNHKCLKRTMIESPCTFVCLCIYQIYLSTAFLYGYQGTTLMNLSSSKISQPLSYLFVNLSTLFTYHLSLVPSRQHQMYLSTTFNTCYPLFFMISPKVLLPMVFVLSKIGLKILNLTSDLRIFSQLITSCQSLPSHQVNFFIL